MSNTQKNHVLALLNENKPSLYLKAVNAGPDNDAYDLTKDKNDQNIVYFEDYMEASSFRKKVLESKTIFYKGILDRERYSDEIIGLNVIDTSLSL